MASERDQTVKEREAEVQRRARETLKKLQAEAKPVRQVERGEDPRPSRNVTQYKVYMGETQVKVEDVEINFDGINSQLRR